ncbi:uncharacterized protein METZ01_LOCUS380270, partial [marine metagenome]
MGKVRLSGQYVFDDMGFLLNPGEAKVEALELIGEVFRSDSQLV